VVQTQRKDVHVMGKYIIIDTSQMPYSGLPNVSVYGPFDTPETANMYAQANNINGYLDILLHPYD